MSTSKTTIGATCLRLRRLPRLACCPVLGVAIPIAIGAVAFQHGFHHDGIAPRGQPRLRQAAFAPPPLPANIKPVAPPAPVAVAAAPAAQRGCRQAAAADRAVAANPAGGRAARASRGGPPPEAPGAGDDPARRCGSGRPGSRRLAKRPSRFRSRQRQAVRPPPPFRPPGQSPKAPPRRQRPLRSLALPSFRAASLCRPLLRPSLRPTRRWPLAASPCRLR